MKQIIKPVILAVTLSVISVVAFPQKNSSPRWLSDKGYWVIEGNINQPLDHIIRFYNNDDVMIYKETVKGVKLNPEKRKVRMKLKKVLETSLVAWEQKQSPSEEMAYIKAILK
jgi:hypothetical protein